jgi:hypothetical protein
MALRAAIQVPPRAVPDRRGSGIRRSTGSWHCSDPAACRCPRRHAESTGAIVGSLQLPDWANTTELLVGVFDSTAPQTGPVACHTIAASEAVEVYIQNLPVGVWHLVAIGKRRGGVTDRDAALLATTKRPIRVSGGEVAGAPALRLAPPTPLRPPIATLFGPPPRDRLPAVGAVRVAS